jgi:hypothetical protein
VSDIGDALFCLDVNVEHTVWEHIPQMALVTDNIDKARLSDSRLPGHMNAQRFLEFINGVINLIMPPRVAHGEGLKVRRPTQCRHHIDLSKRQLCYVLI